MGDFVEIAIEPYADRLIDMKARKILAKVLSGSRNIRFEEFVVLLGAFGFSQARVKGSHHIFYHPAVPRALPIQSVHGKAKPYQIRQLLELIEQYNLTLSAESGEIDEE